jgi:hypothetical protein
MKDNNNKQNVDDTLKEMTENPRQALKEDYNQTKSDMQNVKEGAKDKLGMDNDEEKGREIR